MEIFIFVAKNYYTTSDVPPDHKKTKLSYPSSSSRKWDPALELGHPLSHLLLNFVAVRDSFGTKNKKKNIAKGTTDPRVEFCLPK